MTVFLLTYTDSSGKISNIGVAHQTEKLYKRAALLNYGKGSDLVWVKQTEDQRIAYVCLDPLDLTPDPFYTVMVIPIVG